ncbi:uncharacterized protein LOC115816212 [Chanos chanos]|uniref:Uncharacterized protein LOC115816212 n=1 Tax=Chanos chanos TaxID=29144 RepID=A0A6J2VTJ9_CHACN|nr:uncharacterized protein LOC115816212 [Chanos chanos]
MELGEIYQPFHVVRARLGDSVTLQCFYPEKYFFLAWYKQNVGERPQILASVFKTGDVTFYNEYKNNHRFEVQRDTKQFHLNISNIQELDLAVYYCSRTYVSIMDFGDGTFLTLQGSEKHSVLQPIVTKVIQPGDTKTLQCTVPAEICAGEHSVFWFRQGSGESHPGVIYTHGNRSEKRSEAGSPTQSCVYHLPKRNLSPSDAGTYYCAVATCEEILFGNRTRLDFREAPDQNSATKHKAEEPCRPKEQQEENQDNLNYVALTLTSKRSKVERQRSSTEKETLYSSVRYSNRN